ncbi:UNVERIFIED_CONTAM: hypothetical protein GTU68_029435 [Idotea baltica]|nr:hypothetical protein [Idotea baltica]
MKETNEIFNSLRKSVELLSLFQRRPRNCWDLFKQGDNASGVRVIYPFSCCADKPISVFCDQELDGGGWTVFQRRQNLEKREIFSRKWLAYKLGFGNLTGEFWLGLDNIHALHEKRWEKYEHMFIGNASEKYRLDLGNYSGDAGDSLSVHSGQMFSAKDNDNDQSAKSCAKLFKGAWWYKNCHTSNLNGFQYEGSFGSNGDGIHWKTFRGFKYSLKKTTMALRPTFLY